LEDFKLSPSHGCPATATCLASTQALRSQHVSSASKIPDCVIAHRSDWCSSPVRPVPTGKPGQTHRSDRSGTAATPSSVLRFVDQPRKPRELDVASAHRLPRSLGSTLVLRVNQETVHDFILLFMPPCGPHLTPLATGSLERSLLIFSTPGGLTGDDLSRLFFAYTNTSQAATCTCNTSPRISPHIVVNHSSHNEATIHRSSNHTWSSLGLLGVMFTSLLDLYRASRSCHEVLNELILKVMLSTLKSSINTKLQNRHAQTNLLYQEG
jgi:hypothetical protein